METLWMINVVVWGVNALFDIAAGQWHTLAGDAAACFFALQLYLTSVRSNVKADARESASVASSALMGAGRKDK